jgi:citrate lyase subunit beta/citryl-CoA lyase
MLALHPAQIAIINAGFTPTGEEIDEAQRIVDAFAAQPDAGVLSLDGRMVDRPHLVQAQSC